MINATIPGELKNLILALVKVLAVFDYNCNYMFHKITSTICETLAKIFCMLLLKQKSFAFTTCILDILIQICIKYYMNQNKENIEILKQETKCSNKLRI